MLFKLHYVHDPMCSWCWGFAPCWEQLQRQLPASVEVSYLLGGLAADSDVDMPLEMQRYLQQTWRRIEKQIPSRRFNHDFWKKCRPRRSTYPACRAVIAARMMGEEKEVLMVQTIQNGYYRQARNPSNSETLIELAGDLNLDQNRFKQLLHSPVVEERLQQEIAIVRSLGVSSFPSLVLVDAQDRHRANIEIDYHDPASMLHHITEQINSEVSNFEHEG